MPIKRKETQTMQVTRKRARMKRMHELEQEAPVCEEVRRLNERLTEAVQETAVQQTVEGLVIVIVTEAVQETEVQQMVEGLPEGLLDDDLFVKSLQ